MELIGLFFLLLHASIVHLELQANPCWRDGVKRETVPTLGNFLLFLLNLQQKNLTKVCFYLILRPFLEAVIDLKQKQLK